MEDISAAEAYTAADVSFETSSRGPNGENLKFPKSRTQGPFWYAVFCRYQLFQRPFIDGKTFRIIFKKLDFSKSFYEWKIIPTSSHMAGPSVVSYEFQMWISGKETFYGHLKRDKLFRRPLK